MFNFLPVCRAWSKPWCFLHDSRSKQTIIYNIGPLIQRSCYKTLFYIIEANRIMFFAYFTTDKLYNSQFLICTFFLP